MSEHRIFSVLKNVILKDEKDKKIGTLRAGTRLKVVNVKRTTRKSVISAEMHRAEVVQANEKKVHGFCNLYDFRGNVLVKEEGGSRDELDSKEAEHSPASVLKRFQPLIDKITQEELDKLVECLKERHFKEGDVLMKEGSEGNELFIFQKGKAQISEGGAKLGILVPGDYFGEQAIFHNLDESCIWEQTVTAITDVSCLVASQKMV